MSKQQQKYQQVQLKLKKQLTQDMIKGSNHPNNTYYPFHVPPQNYYHNYMLPYPTSPYLPFYPPPFMPPFDVHINRFEQLKPRNKDREEYSINHHKINSKTVQQKKYSVKIQEFAPNNVQISEQIEQIKPLQRKNKKQLYRTHMNQIIPPCSPVKLSELEIKFKRIIQDHVHGIIEQKFDTSFYEDQFADLIAQDRHFFEEMMVALSTRFKQYKKTKEELIKLIIRRTYHALKHHKNILCQKPEYERLQAFHYKNLTTFKSMNVQFLKREFSNQLFVQLFKEFLQNFQLQFERENVQKIQRYSKILVSCWYKKSTNLVLTQRKLPWVNSYKQKIKKISLELLKEHEGSSSLREFGRKK